MKKQYIIPTVSTVPLLVGEGFLLEQSTIISGPPVEEADPIELDW